MKIAIIAFALFYSSGNHIAAQEPGKNELTVETAYITGIRDGRPLMLEADYVQMLTGDAAISAARKTGEAEFEIASSGDTTWFVMNDYLIVNNNSRIRSLPLSDSAGIFLSEQGTSGLFKSNVQEFRNNFSDKLFVLNIINGIIVRITEVYLP